MNTSHRRWIGIAAAVGGLAALGGCAVAPAGVYGDPYYDPGYVGGPAYVAPAPYVGVDVYSEPRYYGGRPYPGYRPGYPGWHGPAYGGRPSAVRPPVVVGRPGMPGVRPGPGIRPPAMAPSRSLPPGLRPGGAASRPSHGDGP